ncbi:SnoaL-like domain-containing protein [Dyadobacter koreensis]|uniref:SnoaL-like domain-containing protein n=1 Tax=Dyadobacter koreensis TaxID=408657 RepID=A0A1H6QXZ5_9BACT|nr:nuclear transport factor 2 family protein [Dyadobacter koreensis]SEI44135.1 SnoaL-like domain-containing protein [Dyadobacter koreensis]
MKKFVPIFVSLLALYACGERKVSDKNEKIIRQYFEYFNKHDWNSMANLYTATADFKDPSLGQGIVRQTREQTIKKYGELHQTFPDVADKILNVYPSGENHVIVEFVSSGTAPDNSKFELPICTIFKIENGLITEDFTYYDNFEE